MGKQKQKKKQKRSGVLKLVIALVVFLAASVLFIGAVGGWFTDQKIILDEEYYSEEAGLMELSTEEYENLREAKKSFVVFIDQNGCTTADKLRGYIQDWSTEERIRVYRMMFGEAKNSSLHEYIKYYPSVVLIDKGKVRMYLRADSDEDAPMYNDYNEFETWIKKWI